MQQRSLSILLSLGAKDASGSTKTPSGLLGFQPWGASDATSHVACCAPVARPMIEAPTFCELSSMFLCACAACCMASRNNKNHESSVVAKQGGLQV